MEGRSPYTVYHRQMEEVADIEKNYQWLERAGLTDSGTEALMLAAQEQALSTKAIEARIYHSRSHSVGTYSSGRV